MARFRLCLFIALLTMTVLPWTACKKATPPLSLDGLRNAEYRSELPGKGIAKLKDGQYEEEIVPGAASKIQIVMVPDVHAFGDLNGDGVDDAAVILAASGGGSGTFITLEAVVNDQGTPRHAATAQLGDRAQVKSIVIEGGQVTLDVLTHGPDDPMCCPSVKATKKFKLQGDALIGQE